MIASVKFWLIPLLGVFFIVDAFVGLWWWRQRREHSQDQPILAAAKRYGLEPGIIKAIVWRESGFDPSIRGQAKEYGLMQVRAAAAGEWAGAERIPQFQCDTLLSPSTNTLAGAWYLRKLLRRYSQTDNPMAYALADYNAGRKNALRWMRGSAITNSASFLDQMDFPGTRRYIEAILKRRERYSKEFERQ
jgi:soluble lytic murein transglycosylase